jgi:type I restriction enzyme S subunit
MKQGWKTCKYADVFDLQMGKTPSRDNPTYWGDDNMWVSIADMNEQKYMSATKEGITDVAVQESGIKPIPKGTVIMSFKLSIGKVSIATSKLYTNEAIMGFIEKEEGTLVPEYLYYYLKGYKWEGANKAAMGMTLNKKTIAENTI